MARRDALLKIHQTLSTRRNELRKRLGMDFQELQASNVGDVAETALEAEGIEVTGTLAALESRDLAKVEKALLRLKQGRYGECDGCGGTISVARLNFMPTSDLCIGCQRESERNTSWLDDRRQERYEDEHAEHGDMAMV